MIDLCIDARMARSSGIGTCIRQIAPLLDAPPFRVRLLVDRAGESWCERMEQIVCSAPIYSLQEQIALPLRIPRCDLFWTPHYNIPLLSIRAKKRIATLHDTCHLALGQWLSFPEKAYAKGMLKQALHRSDAVTTGSRFTQEEIARYLGKPQKEVHVIPIAVDRQRFRRVGDPEAKDQVRRKYQLPEKFVLFVGNLKPHKNLSALIEAFFEAKLENWSLVVAGKSRGFLHPDRNLDRSRFLPIENPSDEELTILYNLAEMLVFPSFYEGFGLPPLEAMSCGCPAIVSHAASLPEVCGEAALYIDPYKPKEMAVAIQRLAQDRKLKEEMIAKGTEWVQRYDWSETAARYRNLMEQVARA